MNETGVNRNRNHVDKNEGSKERTGNREQGTGNRSWREGLTGRRLVARSKVDRRESKEIDRYKDRFTEG